MKLSVSRELKLPGKPSAATITERWNDFEHLGRRIRFALPVTLSVEYVFDGSGFNVKGSIHTAFHSECARCGKEFIEPFETTFDERFEKTESERDGEDEQEAYPFAGDELELDDLVRDAILLNMSGYSLCREDCKGMCPICGCDLNSAQCSCVREQDAEETENPFLKLRNLLEDDKEV